MFADDTKLLMADKDLKNLKRLESVLDWYENKKLDLNWSKTYFMFITKKRVKLPSEIPINSKITVKVLKTIILLGITIDNKFDFNENSSNLK